MKKIAAILTLMFYAALASAAQVATFSMDQSGVYWTPKHREATLTLTVAGPDDFRITQTSSGSDIALYSFGADGVYKYELLQHPEISDAQKELMQASREEGTPLRGRAKLPEGVKQSGHFRIVDGAPFTQSEKEE